MSLLKDAVTRDCIKVLSPPIIVRLYCDKCKQYVDKPHQCPPEVIEDKPKDE